MKKPAWNYPECSGVPLNDLLRRMILLRFMIKICFWRSCKGLDHDGQTWLFMWTTWENLTVCPWLEFNPDQLSYNWGRDRDLDLFWCLFFFFLFLKKKSFSSDSNGFRKKNHRLRWLGGWDCLGLWTTVMNTVVPWRLHWGFHFWCSLWMLKILQLWSWCRKGTVATQCKLTCFYLNSPDKRRCDD